MSGESVAVVVSVVFAGVAVVFAAGDAEESVFAGFEAAWRRSSTSSEGEDKDHGQNDSKDNDALSPCKSGSRKHIRVMLSVLTSSSLFLMS